MRKEASGCCKEYPDALIFQLQNDEQNAKKLIKFDSKHTIRTKLGKSSPNEARNNDITNKRIETQRIKDST